MKTIKTMITVLAIVALIVPGPMALAQAAGLSASFVADVNRGAAPLTVHFTDESDGGPTGWHWDFGDGSYSTQQNPVYTYNEPGTYTVTLTVTDGARSDAMSGDIIVGNPLAPTPYPGRVPVIVEPILVPIRDPRPGQPPHASPPHDAPDKTPEKAPQKAPQKPPQQPPAKEQPKKNIDKSPQKQPQKPPQKAPAKEQPKKAPPRPPAKSPTKSPQKSPQKVPQQPRDDHKQQP